MTNTVLILGAAGRFGRHTTDAFLAAGWRVRAVLRPGRTAPKGVEPHFGALEDIAAAAMGADVIVNALNPPYHHWARELPRQTAAVIAAARASGATVLIPGNVYNYGANLPAILSEATPHIGDHRKAQLRIAMEAAYRDACIPTIILRAGDFIDDAVSGNWFDSHIAGKAHKGQITYPGPTDLPHVWAWLPDVARAAVMLANKRETLSPFQEVCFPGYTLTGAELIAAAETAMGRPLKQGRFPWWPLSLMATFSPIMREVRAMRYLWNRPHQIDGALFQSLLPTFTETLLATAMTQALSAYATEATLKNPASVDRVLV
jgi:nucleoside-diphosphate-sugar epimerase